ncbi:2'-5' RNA ligase family protein [Novosphingobium sp. 1Y9A]|uniref:2'-5' RNA ligase family protein n=1 Tax=Novosphingobium jiangmenense TaxID=2791981 RepID=A0ABS0HLN7_9SPHN|nr:2'-5' RNA ligase family protein [Novosphingobium jiangmenense]
MALPNVPAFPVSLEFGQDTAQADGVTLPSGLPPLIVTALLPPDLQAWADRLRREHYPPERNQLSAHVTLFHALPGRLEDEVRERLSRLAAMTPPLEATLSGVMDLGSGTALRIECPEMLALYSEIAEHFHGMLSAQDQQAPRLHVTIQNKVARPAARALQDALAADLRGRRFAFAGIALHRYLGGPWESLGRWSFRASPRRKA